MMGDEDYKHFDPKAYWAKVNGEPPKILPGIKEWEKAKELIHYCWKPRTAKEIEADLKLPAGKLTRLLHVITHTRGFMIDRRDEAGSFTYQITDRRTQAS